MSIDIESFINKLGVDYKKEGRLFKISCPWHHDKHPSLVVYPQDRGFYCYPCGKGGTWQYLYKEMKGCSWREAYEALEIEDDYHQEYHQERVRYDFVDPVPPQFIQAVQKKYSLCEPLSSAPQIVQDFLSSKHLFAVAEEQGWRWDKGVFKQSRPSGALVIPYYEGGEIVSARLRPLTDQIEKPKSLLGTQSRPYPLLRPNLPLYIAEGETDSLSLYASGCNVVGVPGATQKRCINTAVLYASLTNAPYIVACGDNDGPGQQMDALIESAAEALTDVPTTRLTPDCLSDLNDINDAYVAGKLHLDRITPPTIIPSVASPEPPQAPSAPQPDTSTIEQILGPLEPLDGFEAVWALAQFEDNGHKILAMAGDTSDLISDDTPDEEVSWYADILTANSTPELRSVWIKTPPIYQHRYETLKDIVKLGLAKLGR